MPHTEDLFRRMVEASTDGLWIFDTQGTTEYANAAMATLLGRTSEEMRGLSVFEALDEEAQPQFREHLEEMATWTTGEENRECLFWRPDGTSFWSLVSFAPLLDDEGEVVSWLHRVTDFSQTRSLLDRLRASEESLAEAQRVASVGSWSWDVAEDRVEWSDELFRMYEMEAGAQVLTFDTYLSRVLPEDRDIVTTTVGQSLQGHESFEHEVRIVLPSGGQAWIRGRGACEVVDGTVVRMFGTAQDVTVIKEAERERSQALARSRGQRAVASAANTAADVPSAVRRTCDLLPEHMSWRITGAWLVDGANGLRSVDEEARPGPPSEEAEQALLTGSVIHRARGGGAAAPVTADNEVVAVVELSHESDDEDAWDLEIVEYVAGQLSLVAERERAHRQVAAARDQAVEASRMKSDFLATMSHEIRTPLNAVIGLNDLLLQTSLDGRQREYAEGAQMAGQSLLDLINDILDFSKIEAGKLEIETVDFEVRAVFEQLARLLGDRAHQQGIELVVACHPDTPTFLRGDPVRLGQVLANLGSNAVKFTERGEVVVHAHVAGRDDSTARLRIEVTDTGIGIPVDRQADLFSAFTQADGSTTRRFGGSGLGLAITRRLVSAMGGEVGVISAPGSGSTFWCEIPLGLSDHRAVAPGPESAPGVLTGLRALVVDDNVANRRILLEQLSAWDVDVDVASGADEALAILRDRARGGRPVQVLLLDYWMPEVDGLDLARMVRADHRVSDVEIMLLSSSMDVDREECDRLGIVEKLRKPVLHSHLYEALQRVLGGSPEPVPRTVTGAEAKGRTVLVVEDNPMNQMVALGLLESFGYDAMLAPDGAEALRLLDGDHDVALVLMDCQMPVMDGYDATRALREREREGRRPRIPVLAMTAAAIQGERERCLEAGMDDFLTKPVDRDTLRTSLEHWIADHGESSAPASVRPEDTPVLDPARLTMLRELRKGERSLLDDFVARFATSARDDVAQARTAVTGGRAEDLRTTAHRLKGAALNLGLPRLGALCGDLEDDSEALLAEGDATTLDLLETEVERALTGLAGFLESS